MAPKRLNFITGNANKLTEVKAILGDLVDLRSQSLDLVEVQGNIDDISADKCRRAAELVKGPVLVEDTCLCFSALKGLPGNGSSMTSALKVKKVHLAAAEVAFADKPEGLNNLLAAYDDKTAQAVCTFAYSEGPGKEPKIFQGRTDGKIVSARGPSRFGWDPIFEYDGQTYAEMTALEKNKISHRFKALEKLKAWLQEEA
ncbi:MAG: nucleoside triphosphate pyrophosphohydrolase ham1 [Trichoglossum hirsutum]|nr:MAG: nucleoside triphosphate pyrophosphohydrolase ham1 [Trichoglossum hirsutum]